MTLHHSINYLEYPCSHFEETQRFFEQVFAWQFQSYGDDYMAFSNAGLEGGFYRSDLYSATAQGAALCVFYSSDLEQSLREIQAAGGRISRAIFAFPGGRRFHFIEPSGNEFAVWSDKE